MANYFADNNIMQNNQMYGGQQSRPANNQGYIPAIPITDQQTVRMYPVAANNSVILIDFNAGKFFIKSTNEYGVQNPIREFDFTEKVMQIQNQQNGGVSREEFEAQQKKLDDLMKLLEDLTAPSK